jgi:cytochrome c-type biogenesis protein CcmE
MEEKALNPATHQSMLTGRGKWFALGALALAAVAFGVITAGGIGKNLVYYWNPTELQSAGNKAYGATIRLGGMVKAGSIVHAGGPSSLEFDVTDYKSVVHVKAHSVPPQMFRDNIGVVIEGTMNRAGYYDGSKLMVSHNNEYKAPKDLEHVDTKEMMKSTEGLSLENGVKR